MVIAVVQGMRIRMPATDCADRNACARRIDATIFAAWGKYTDRIEFPDGTRVRVVQCGWFVTTTMVVPC